MCGHVLRKPRTSGLAFVARSQWERELRAGRLVEIRDRVNPAGLASFETEGDQATFAVEFDNDVPILPAVVHLCASPARESHARGTHRPSLGKVTPVIYDLRIYKIHPVLVHLLVQSVVSC